MRVLPRVDDRWDGAGLLRDPTPERCLLALALAAERMARLPRQGAPVQLGHEVASALHALLAAAAAAEEAGCRADDLRAATRPAAALYEAESRLVAHARQWPLGHPGDFELIEGLLDVRANGVPGSLGHALDATVLQLPIVWQHRAKIAWQAGLVRRHLGGSSVVRVLSIGCGGSRDLALLEPHELARLEVTLSDLDARALALSRSRLEGRVRGFAVEPGNALRAANRFARRGPFDVILVGGLLDYLPERAAQLLLARALGMLAEGGTLGATNVAAGNPWRHMLELVCDWPLIERTAAQMASLLEGPTVSHVLALDDSRLTWLARAEANARPTDDGASAHRA